MVQIDVPIAFAAGCVLADAARQGLREGRREQLLRGLLATNLFNIVFFSVIPAYFLMNYFGWETTHMWWHADSIAAYPLFLPIFAVALFAAGNLGFLAGAALVKRGRTRVNRAVYLGIAAYSAIWTLGQVDRTFRLGTYREWKAGTAPWLHEDPVFVGATIATGIVFVITLAVLARWLHHAPEAERGPATRA